METGNMLRKSRRSERRKRKREGHIRHNSSLKPEKESSVPVCLHVSVCDSVCVCTGVRTHTQVLHFPTWWPNHYQTIFLHHVCCPSHRYLKGNDKVTFKWIATSMKYINVRARAHLCVLACVFECDSVCIIMGGCSSNVLQEYYCRLT